MLSEDFIDAFEHELYESLENKSAIQLISGRWALSAMEKGERPLFFNPAQIYLRHVNFFKGRGFKQEILFRALGKNLSGKLIVDLSTGLAGDSLLMLAMGAKVHSYERNPSIFLMLYREYQKLDDELKQKWKIHYGSCQDFQEGDVYFFDPMYGSEVSKAKSSKEMRIFREVVRDDEDSESFAQEVFNKSQKRLVIKRSKKGKVLLEKPGLVFNGKSTRYDVYLP